MRGWRYVAGGQIARSVPKGKTLAHNHVVHGPWWGCGLNGFRAWWCDKPPKGFVRCPCGYAGLPHYAWRKHADLWRENPKRMLRKAARALGEGGWNPAMVNQELTCGVI